MGLRPSVNGKAVIRAEQVSNETPLRIVLLGKSVSENSVVGNLILGRSALDSEAPPDVVERVGGRLKHRHVTLINSPQLLHKHISDDQITQMVRECVSLSDPGPQVVVLLLQHQQCSAEDQERVEKLQDSFSERLLQHTLVLSTQESTEPNQILQKIIQKCSNRHFSLQRSSSADHLLQAFEDIEQSNEGRHLISAQYEASKYFSVEQEATQRDCERLNVLVCGSDGSQKSSISELILQHTHRRSESVRTDVDLHTRLISVLKLPALFNTGFSEEEVMRQTLRCVSRCHPGVHAFLLIIPDAPLNNEDRAEMEEIQKIFSSRINKYIMILIMQNSDHQTAELNEETKAVIQSFGGRHHYFNPKTQVSTLMENIEKMLEENRGGFYSTETFLEAQMKNLMKYEEKKKLHSLETQSSAESEDELRIVLLGKTGVGKSSTGNTILGRDVFAAGTSQESVTEKSQRESSKINDRRITVIDTPGLFDTELSKEEIQREISNCISMICPGPHVLFIVLSLGQRFTKESKSVKFIQETFGEHSLMFTMVLFTRGDFLENKTLEEFLGKPGSVVRKLLETCGNRYHVINNNQPEDRTQVSDLLEMIDNMVKANGGSFYSCKMFREMEREKQEQQMKILMDRVRETEEKMKRLEKEKDKMKMMMEEKQQKQEKETLEKLKQEKDRMKREREDLQSKHEEEKNRMKIQIQQMNGKREELIKKHEEEKMKMTLTEQQNLEKERKSREELKKEISKQEKQQRETIEEMKRERETFRHEIEEMRKEREKLQTQHKTETNQLMKRIKDERENYETERTRREGEFNQREEQYKRQMKEKEEREKNICEEMKKEHEKLEKLKLEEKDRTKKEKDITSKHEEEKNRMKIQIEQINGEREELMKKHEEEKEKMKTMMEEEKKRREELMKKHDEEKEKMKTMMEEERQKQEKERKRGEELMKTHKEEKEKIRMMMEEEKKRREELMKKHEEEKEIMKMEEEKRRKELMKKHEEEKEKMKTVIEEERQKQEKERKRREELMKKHKEEKERMKMMMEEERQSQEKERKRGEELMKTHEEEKEKMKMMMEEEKKRREELMKKHEEKERTKMMMEEEKKRREELMKTHKEEKEKMKMMMEEEKKRREELMKKHEEEKERMKMMMEEEKKRREELMKNHEEEKERMKMMMMEEERQKQEKERKRGEELMKTHEEEKEKMKMMEEEKKRREELMKKHEEEKERTKMMMEEEKKWREQLMKKHEEEKERMKMMMEEERQSQEKERKRGEELMKKHEEEKEKMKMMMEEEKKRREELMKKHEEEKEKMKMMMEEEKKRREELMKNHEEEKERMKMMMEEERQKQEKERKRREEEFKEREEQNKIQIRGKQEEWEKQKQEDEKRREEKQQISDEQIQKLKSETEGIIKEKERKERERQTQLEDSEKSLKEEKKMREDQQKSFKEKLKLLEKQHKEEREQWRKENDREKEKIMRKIKSETDNSLQVAAYRKLETIYSEWSWSLHNAMMEIENKLHNQIENEAIQEVKETDLQTELKTTSEEVEKYMTEFFEKDTDKYILIQSKTSFKTKIKELQENVLREAKNKLNEILQQHDMNRKIDAQRKHHENTLYAKCKNQSEITSEKIVKSKFYLIWEPSMKDIIRDTSAIREIDIMRDVRKTLSDIYESAPVDQWKDSRDIFKVKRYSEYVWLKRNYRRSGLLQFTIEWFGYILSKVDEAQIRSFVSDVVHQTDRMIQSFNITKTGYNISLIQQLIYYINTRESEHEEGAVKYVFKDEFFIDLVYSICNRANKTITDQHTLFREANDPEIYLKNKREEYYSIFQKYCHGAKSAAIFAEIICQKLKEPIEQSVYKKTARDLADEIRSNCESLNGNRTNLEKHILKTLAEEEDFDKYMNYIHHPREHFKSFIRDEVSRYIKDKFRVSQYLPKINKNIKLLQQKIMNAAHQSTEHVQVNSGDVGLWLKSFTQQLSDQLIFSEKDLSEVKHDDVDDFRLLEDVIRQELPAVMSDIKGRFNKDTFPVKLDYKFRPDELLIDRLCQCCWVQCPFCGATCTNTTEGHHGDHSVPFHRVIGLNRQFCAGTRNLSITICTSAVASDQSFNLTASPKSVPWRDYRTAGGVYADWSITPDLSELPYWKWFVCRFQKDLEKYYSKTFEKKGNIPVEWKKYTKRDAAKSLD
ncbi:thyroid receptor-interacting protein 11-like [Danio aesculapii]|uniref:thyroid receptor-interacting protein 11-like n=1 Tax=Danio aesculapii TaxID=1142201 RepID=UPI0024BF3EA8|nr:thyroid receptor-interacting protein 11-like [Danio aesculapii]